MHLTLCPTHVMPKAALFPAYAATPYCDWIGKRLSNCTGDCPMASFAHDGVADRDSGTYTDSDRRLSAVQQRYLRVIEALVRSAAWRSVCHSR